ncbi:flagellin [Halorarum salinum]|uniref:Flagellin n=1 Tax=Halorarum salinum TaxID=2743089 RepID=A0A7D5QEX5_9EURY|nr:flagellin [Halobaculum salinum]QLG61022.1 flagellin [Halobaculum salinum]
MGLSVSAATAVVFLGLFVAAGAFYPAVANGAELVTDAQHDANDRALDQQNTDITVTNATYDADNDTLVVNATNEGSTALDLASVDLIADNTYLEANATVEGDGDTDVWLPGERARFEVDTAEEPDRATVVVDHGVRDGAAVEVI